MYGFVIGGGKSSRMGGLRKLLCQLSDQTLLTRINARFAPQVDRFVINANDRQDFEGKTNDPVIEDELAGHLGPLAGIHTCLSYARANAPNEVWIASVASDTPFIPSDLVEKLEAVASDNVDAVIASCGGQAHRLCGLWRTSLLARLEKAILEDETRAVRHWLKDISVAEVAFSETPFDPFFNINTPEDLLEGERLIEAHNL